MDALLEKVDPVTGTFIGVMVIIFILWDIWRVWIKGNTATLSWVTLIWSCRYPAITLALGVLLGHLVVPQYLPCPASKEVHCPAVRP